MEDFKAVLNKMDQAERAQTVTEPEKEVIIKHDDPEMERRCRESVEELMRNDGELPPDDIWEPLPDDIWDSDIHSILGSTVKNLEDAPKISTMIDSIDSRTFGGATSGGYHVVAGVAGSGKTSWVLQMCSNLLKQDMERRQKRDPEDPPYTRGILIYSAEMPEAKIHRIMSYQLAEGDDVRVVPGVFPKYYVKAEADKRIFCEYDKHVKYIKPVLNAGAWSKFKKDMYKYAKAGIRVFVFDNLLTLVSMVSMDPAFKGATDFTLQGAVAAWLGSFAAETDSYCYLIAHTKKDSGYESNDPNDSISGNKAVVNLATLIMFFGELPKDERGDDPDTTDRLCRLTKNRDFDKKLTKGVRTKFDRLSWSISEQE